MSTNIHNTDGGPYCVQVLFTSPEYLYMNDKIHKWIHVYVASSLINWVHHVLSVELIICTMVDKCRVQ